MIRCDVIPAGAMSRTTSPSFVTNHLQTWRDVGGSVGVNFTLTPQNIDNATYFAEIWMPDEDSNLD